MESPSRHTPASVPDRCGQRTPPHNRKLVWERHRLATKTVGEEATWDLSLRKSFKLPQESMNLMFQADAFNVFNRVNWGNPGTSANGGAG